MSLVSLSKIEGSNIKQAIAKALALVDFTFRKELRDIVIKINACYYWDYTTGQTTDPAFVANLIALIREKASSDIKIALVESDASAMKCKYAYKFLGYEKLSKGHNVRLVNLSEEESEAVSATCGEETYHFQVPNIIRNADLRINLPKIKYAMKGIELTCALKNIYGCNPYPRKFKYHRQLGNVIVALNKAMKFDLCIIDGNIVSGIQPRRMGLVMASQDPVAIDSAAAEIAGLDAKAIDYIQLAKEEGLGSTSFVPKGLPIEHFKAIYPKKTIGKKLMTQAYTLATRVGLGKRLGVS